MSIKKKMAAFYFLLTLILFLSVCTGIVTFNASKTKEKAFEDLSSLSQTIKNQYETSINKYAQVATTLLADDDFVGDLRTLSFLERTEDHLIYLEKAYRRINKKISTYSNIRTFSRVNIFSSNNDFITNDANLSSVLYDFENDVQKVLQMGLQDSNEFYVPNMLDKWGNTSNYLFSYFRKVNFSNGTFVYISVEDLQENVNSLYPVNQASDISYFVINTDNRAIMASSMNADYSLLQAYLNQDSNVNSFKNHLVSTIKFHENKQQLIVFQNIQNINSSIMATSFLIIFISTCILVMMFFIYKRFVYRLLTPLETLKEDMETLTIETLPTNTLLVSDENEITSLSKSYSALKNRLNSSIENELVAQRKQFEANMEVLQAQIDPHFMYNIMNIIAYKGMEFKDKDTIEIAHGIADMLRYSTSNVEKQASFKDEFNHVENYLILMKKRYQDMLNYTIDLPEMFEKHHIPKLVLQIFAENSIKYSFENGQDSLSVNISVVESRNYQWMIEIKDDGPGINKQTLEKLMMRITEINNLIAAGHSLQSLENEIGGLGIVNTYSRLRLYYGEKFQMKINTHNQGTVICLLLRRENEKNT